MTAWIGIVLDVFLIALVGVGIAQAMRLITQLKDLRASRAEMQLFVRDFNAAVMRAEAGIKGLRSAARETGDDLERLIDKGTMIRDELNFIVESADSVAERLSVAASAVMHTGAQNARASEAKPEEVRKSAVPPQAPAAVPESRPVGKSDAPPNSRAEKELLQALQKLK